MKQYDFPTAFSLWEDEEKAAIARVIESGRFTMGPEVEAFEHEFAAYHERKHAIMVNSGSSANLLAVAALHAKPTRPLQRPHRPVIEWDGRGRGVVKDPGNGLADRVIAPAIAWSTTYSPLIQHDMEMELADVDDTWNAPVPQWFSITNLRLIVAAPILGNPHYAAEWKAVADAHGAYLLEDCCESLGARGPDGKLCGSHGIMATYSFFYSHQISAVEGGMVTTDDDECARMCRILRAHGWTRDVDPPQTFDEEYSFSHFGFNIRALEMHAAIAREQLKKLLRFQSARLMNVAHFIRLTEGMPIRHPKRHGAPNPFGLHFMCEDNETRARLVAALRANGIDARLPTGGSMRLHEYGQPWRAQLTPQADEVHRCGLFLGNAPFTLEKEIDKAVKVMRTVF